MSDCDDEYDGNVCSVCRRPVLYGERHHGCGAAVLTLESRIAALEAENAKLRELLKRAYGYTTAADGLLPEEIKQAVRL